MRWSGRPIIYQAARAHEFTIIISPHRALRPRNPPARMVRSAVLLFGDVCGMIVGVDALGFFGMVTRTASRTLRNHHVSQPTSAHGTFRGPFIWRRLRQRAQIGGQAPSAAPRRMLAKRRLNRCQAPGAEPGWMLAKRQPKSVPGTRCGARSDASKQGPKSVPGTRCGARSDASKQEPKSVPGTRQGPSRSSFPLASS